MNNRSAIATFFLILFLLVIIILQILSMLQSDKLYEQINTLDDVFRDVRFPQTAKEKPSISDDQEYPGDEGDWLIWAFAVEPKTLNQISVNSDIYSRWMTFGTVFESLLTYSYDEVKLEPLLAESYETSEDGLEITFTLRDDIYFSDGVPITADDVVFTYETIVNPKIDAANIASLFVNVDRAEKINDMVVRFYLKKSEYTSLETVSLYTIGVYPKHIYDFNDPEEFNKRVSNPVGSGPYVFEKWDVGSKINFRRNENYWGSKPKLKKVVYRFITNDKARLQALQAGDVDIIIPSPDQFMDLIKEGDFKDRFKCLSYWNPGAPFFYIGWNQDTPFFADRRVRLAMTHMFDREAFIKYVLKDSGKITTGPFFIHGKENNSDIKPWPYDTERAKELLNEAGWTDSDGDGVRDKNGVPFRFEFSYSSDSLLYQNLAKTLKDSAAKIGIEIIADPVEWSVLLPRLTDHDFDSMVMGWGGQIIDDHYQLFHSSQIDNRGFNHVSFRNPEADRLTEQIRVTLDEEKRIKLSHELHSLIHEEQPYTFLFARPTYRILSKRFENVIVHKLGLKEEEWFVPKEQQRYK